MVRRIGKKGMKYTTHKLKIRNQIARLEFSMHLFTIPYNRCRGNISNFFKHIERGITDREFHKIPTVMVLIVVVAPMFKADVGNLKM